MADIAPAPHGFAYLFERFPSFSQTFCVREVRAMQQRGLQFPVFSIRTPSQEPAQDCFSDIGPVTFLPEKYDQIIANDSGFRRAARKALDDLKALWGSEEEKRRIYEALWLGPVLKKAGVRHVHVHFAGLGSRTAFWLKRLFGVNFSITAHANDIFRDEPPERLAQIFEAATVVVTVSDFSVAYLQRQYPKLSAKFCRVYNGIAVNAFQTSTFPEGKPLILSVGRYIEKKGFSTLVDACAKLGDRAFECKIVGTGPLEEPLKQQVADLGLAGKVFITGPRTEGDIRRLLERSWVFALPCITAEDGAMDNLPTVIMEAMAAAVPVVSTPVAAIPEMTHDGQTGYIVPENDAEATAARMAALLDRRESAIAMGQAGRELCRQLFDLNITSASLGEVLRKHDAIRN